MKKSIKILVVALVICMFTTAVLAATTTVWNYSTNKAVEADWKTQGLNEMLALAYKKEYTDELPGLKEPGIAYILPGQNEAMVVTNKRESYIVKLDGKSKAEKFYGNVDLEPKTGEGYKGKKIAVFPDFTLTSYKRDDGQTAVDAVYFGNVASMVFPEPHAALKGKQITDGRGGFLYVTDKKEETLSTIGGKYDEQGVRVVWRTYWGVKFVFEDLEELYFVNPINELQRVRNGLSEKYVDVKAIVSYQGRNYWISQDGDDNSPFVPEELMKKSGAKVIWSMGN